MSSWMLCYRKITKSQSHTTPLDLRTYWRRQQDNRHALALRWGLGVLGQCSWGCCWSYCAHATGEGTGDLRLLKNFPKVKKPEAWVLRLHSDLGPSFLNGMVQCVRHFHPGLMEQKGLPQTVHNEAESQKHNTEQGRKWSTERRTPSRWTVEDAPRGKRGLCKGTVTGEWKKFSNQHSIWVSSALPTLRSR